MLSKILMVIDSHRSTIITSQLPVTEWYDVIGEQTISDAILDNVVHNAHSMELAGESLRRRQRKKSLKMLKQSKKI